MKRTSKTLPMFVDGATAAVVGNDVERIRVLVRRARRFTTKAESKAGITANVALHEAEALAKSALRRLGGESC